MTTQAALSDREPAQLARAYEHMRLDEIDMYLQPPDAYRSTAAYEDFDGSLTTAARLVRRGSGRGFNIIFHGGPGTGKTRRAAELARLLGVPSYTLQAHQDLLPSDLTVTRVDIGVGSGCYYVASAVLTGALRGGAVILDDVGKAHHDALEPLASALDTERRFLSAHLLSRTFELHPHTFFILSLQHGERLPTWLCDRRMAWIEIKPPPADALARIVRNHAPSAPDILIEAAIEYFSTQRAGTITPRRAIQIIDDASIMAEDLPARTISATVADRLVREAVTRHPE